MPQTNPIKTKYFHFADKIIEKRFSSPFHQRRYIHKKSYDSFLKHVTPRQIVADIGSGEGVLSALMAKKNTQVVAVEISKSNIVAAKQFAKHLGVNENIHFVLGDAENIPLKTKRIDLVVSSHVLEHLPSFDRGLSELKRIAKGWIIIGVPTCLNWCAIPLLGGGNYWQLSLFTPLHIVRGLLRIIISLGSEGVNEGYAGTNLPHIWRYPWTLSKRLKKANLKIESIEAPSLVPPYLLTYITAILPIYKLIDLGTRLPLLKHMGYGTTLMLKND